MLYSARSGSRGGVGVQDCAYVVTCFVEKRDTATV